MKFVTRWLRHLAWWIRRIGIAMMLVVNAEVAFGCHEIQTLLLGTTTVLSSRSISSRFYTSKDDSRWVKRGVLSFATQGVLIGTFAGDRIRRQVLGPADCERYEDVPGMSFLLPDGFENAAIMAGFGIVGGVALGGVGWYLGKKAESGSVPARATIHAVRVLGYAAITGVFVIHYSYFDL